MADLGLTEGQIRAACPVDDAQSAPQSGATAQQLPRSGSGEFDSPMLLEVPLAELLAGKNIGHRLMGFVCEDAAIVFLQMARGETQGSRQALDFSGVLRVRESYDRWVDLDFTVLVGDDEVGRVGGPPIDAEEGRNTRFRKRMWLSPAVVSQLESAPDAILRINMKVREN